MRNGCRSLTGYGKNTKFRPLLLEPLKRGKNQLILSINAIKVFNLTGETTLSELAGVLSLSCLHLGVDSAAPQIAAAVSTPTITIYGPSVWSEWAPPGAMHSVIIPDCSCAPCHQKGCDGSGISKCLEELTIDKVKRAIQKFLNKSGILIT